MTRSILSTCVLTLFAVPAVAEPTRYAVLVGVKEYDHARLPALQYTENDVVALNAVLRAAGYRTILLCDTEGRRAADRKPTKANVDRAIRATLTQYAKGDTVLFAFAGHGFQFEGGDDCFFCPSDAKPFADQTASLVSLGQLYRDLDRAFAGVKILLVDACRNDPNPNRGRGGIDGDTAPKPPQGVAALFSCSAGQRAYEHAKLEHGVFFHYVIEGMKGAAKDEDGEVTFGRLSEYVAKRVEREVPKLIGAGAKQAPNQKTDLSGRSPVLLTAKGGAIAPPDKGPPVEPAPTKPFTIDTSATFDTPNGRRTLRNHNGSLSSTNPSTGDAIWHRNPPSPILLFEVSPAKDRVVAFDRDGFVAMYDLMTGKEIWRVVKLRGRVPPAFTVTKGKGGRLVIQVGPTRTIQLTFRDAETVTLFDSLAERETKLDARDGKAIP